MEEIDPVEENLLDKSDGLVVSSAMLPHRIRQRIVDKPAWFRSNDDYGYMTIDLSAPPNLLAFASLRPDPSEKLSATQAKEKDKQLTELARKITDLTVDVFDIIMASWIEDDESSVLYIDDFLEMRGLARRSDGAFDYDAKEEIRAHISILNNMWVTADKVQMYKDNSGQVERVFEKLHGKLLSVTGYKERKKEGDAEYKPYAWIIRPGPPMIPFLRDPNKQFARMTKAVLEFHPVNEAIEKRIARHLVWHFRIRQARGDYLRSFNNGKVLSAAAVNIDTRNPSRSKDRIEKAWDRLVEKNIIRDWQYDGEWNEQIAAQKAWRRKWLKANILFEPSIDVEDSHKTIAAVKSSGRRNRITPADNVIEELDQVRRMNKMSQLVLAEKLQIAPSYLSMLFRGTRPPSREVKRKIVSFLEAFNKPNSQTIEH